MITQLFAGIPVTDYAASLAWYERLLGRPADLLPSNDEAAWRLTDSAWIYIVAEPTRAGAALHTLLIEDLDEFLSGVAARGIEAGPVEMISDGSRFALLTDPEGNSLKLGQPPPQQS
jgi:predicted enzyme related to lactoylglutathione lyase